MNIAIIHTDFRIYWPARLQALHAFLRARGHQLSVVEIAGEGSPYAFSERAATGSLPWHVRWASCPSVSERLSTASCSAGGSRGFAAPPHRACRPVRRRFFAPKPLKLF